MSDPQPDPPTNPIPNTPVPDKQQAAGGANSLTDFDIGKEFGTAKRNLPPAGIVVACIASVAIIVAIYGFIERPKPQGSGSINLVTAAEAPGQNTTLVAITLTLQNKTSRALWIKHLKAQLTTSDGKTFEDDAASAVDFDRYYQGFPVLKEGSGAPLTPETKLQPGTEQRGTIIVAFKVTRAVFEQRHALTVEIEPYDEPVPIVLR
jgi:hypothetical protein